MTLKEVREGFIKLNWTIDDISIYSNDKIFNENLALSEVDEKLDNLPVIQFFYMSYKKYLVIVINLDELELERIWEEC